jgi:glutamate--cysteine ligase
VTDSSQLVESVEDLVQYFHAAETPVEDWRIGTEHEKIGILPDTRERVPYEGERGIRALLQRIGEVDGWAPLMEGDQLIGLRKQGASITLEPGGQIELSGAPLLTLAETCREFNEHVDMLGRLAADFDIAWLALGADPLHEVAEIPRVPKVRYDIMRGYLPERGPLALEMMYATATVQANYDYSDEEDMAGKMRTAMACSPLASAIFANSSICLGKESGFVSRRVEVWRHVDPDRCGLLPFVLEPGFGYRDYSEWALDVPMFFLVRGDRYIPGDGLRFRDFIARGFAGERATLADWDLHLTTLFPEVRLKRVIEVRGADAVPRDLICALPALWKGLLYDAGACAAAWEIARSWSIEELEAARRDVARSGLRARIAGREVLELAWELVEIASEGLRAIGARLGSDADERTFLDPIRAQLERGRSPGEEILELWRGDWAGDMDCLIDYARY